MRYLTEEEYEQLSSLLNERRNLMEYQRLTSDKNRTLAESIERNRKYKADRKAIEDKIDNLLEEAGQ